MVLHGIDECWYEDVKFANAGAGNVLALGIRFGVRKQNTFPDVASHLPEIGRMRLLYVDQIESDPIVILLIQTVERGNLPAKWRSSVTSEDENYRPESTH